MSTALFLGMLALLSLSACGEGKRKPVPLQGPVLEFPEGVIFRPNSDLSPGLILESRKGKPHLLHVEVKVPDGQQLLSLRLLAPVPSGGFQEIAKKDTSQLDSLVIKESFEIALSGAPMKATHVVMIADFESGSYAATQALPNF